MTDTAEIDAALRNALKLPKLDALRELLARDPGLSARDIAGPDAIELESETAA